jgi:hypothetical protein
MRLPMEILCRRGRCRPASTAARQKLSYEETRMTSNQDKSMNIRAAYDQLCASYHAIDDFRAKLLGFLPLVTGGGLVLLTGKGDRVAQEFFLPIGLFGLVVTLGLFTYELYGIKKCHALINAGQDLESALTEQPGQFRSRPRAVLGHINEPMAAALIYPGVMGAWAYLATYHAARQAGPVLAAVVFVTGFAATFEYDRQLGKDARKQAVEMPHRSHGDEENRPRPKFRELPEGEGA